ncbi:hypothetical protein MMAN_41040 [Mycobacterium mantenii]|uniref:Phospholipid/glycerol acyltransferase domain-containing protein n=1 Tax=Mycobacterium mantenii TaxID=560555 RepID=A0ABM7JX34_MYCNT|nr:hypothetical protein MMAN_41040 [Mycobacterium mantenii]
MSKTGFIRANHDNADAALRAGGVVVVFPGGDYDVYRSTRSANIVDFNGRTGYVKAALNAEVPIVPAVSIGGQENQQACRNNPLRRGMSGPPADQPTGPRAGHSSQSAEAASIT